METVWVTVYEQVYVMTRANYEKVLRLLSTQQPVQFKDYGIQVVTIEANIGTMSAWGAQQRLAEIERAKTQT